MEERETIEQLREEINELKGTDNKQKKSFMNTIIGVIILGALGSALWETCLSPLAQSMFLHASSIISLVSLGFIDDLYREVSKGFHEKSSILLFCTYWGAVMGIYISMWIIRGSIKKEYKVIKKKHEIIKTNGDNDDNLTILYKDNKAFRKKKLSIIKKIFSQKFVTSIITILVILYGIITVGKESFINTTITNTLGNIEIVSPYIEDKEYKQLKSNFYSMQNQQDYLKLIEKIENIAQLNEVELKKVK